MKLIDLAENRWLPDPIIRFGMRRLLRERLSEETDRAGAQPEAALDRFAEVHRQGEVTVAAHLANEQHYEVPAEFFQLVLGPRLKYSCGWWADDNTTLAESEEAMLDLSCQRAEIVDGMNIMDLGCGWGSLSLWIAEKYPNCQITSLSNSSSQRAFIERRCAQRGLSNVRVVTADVGSFDTTDRFDRVVSVEMFEHVRNHEDLLARIAKWLTPEGKLFVHIFCHRSLAYTFETEGKNDWMGRHFFSGGIMPAENLFRRYQSDLSVRRQWWINGMHYAKTCEAWLALLDNAAPQAKRVLAVSDNPDAETIQLQRWRMFFMACAELFRYRGGEEWGVAHYLFDPKRADGSGK